MATDQRTKLQARARRLSGQLAGIERMIAEDRYCMDILTQISAARSALNALGVELLTRHVEGCLLGKGKGAHAGASAHSKEELVEELRAVLGRFLG